MIRVEIQGRLGNQLFQYAFAYASAKYHNTVFFLDKSSQPYFLNLYFELRFGERYLMKIAQSIFKVWHKNKKNYIDLTQNGNEDPVDILCTSYASKTTLWSGFFQSLSYFEKHQKDIRQLFEIKKAYKLVFEKKYKSVFDNHKTLVIHIRRTDYLTYGDDSLGGINLTLPMSYYDDCLSKITNLQQYYIIILSDDIAFAKSYFSSRDNFHYETNSEIIDFQIIQNADCLVIANSTFSWWAAFLNMKKNVRIFAPKKWLGFKICEEYPKGILDGLQWNQVDINMEGV
jgi:hypothetical protein